MHQLWPSSPSSSAPEVSRSELVDYYPYPPKLTLPYVRVNVITSLNGKMAVDGRSAGLGSEADEILFGRLRWYADVVLVGAGTVKADGYRGARTWDALKGRRRERGLSDVVPIAVVTGSANIDPDSALFVDASIPPIILTVQDAPADKVKRLQDAGADVIYVGRSRAEVREMLRAFADRKLYRVLCEGGPSLLQDLIAADAVDDLCVTVAPYLGGSGHVSTGEHSHVNRMKLESVLAADDALLVRYTRARSIWWPPSSKD